MQLALVCCPALDPCVSAHAARSHTCPPLRASKIARGLCTSICSMCSSVTPSVRSAGRMSSEMYV